MRPLGYTVGETTPQSAVFIADDAPRVGQFVAIGETAPCLAFVKRVSRASPFVSGDLYDPRHAARIGEMEEKRDFCRAEVSLYGVVGERGLVPVVEPPPSASPVFAPGADFFRRAFSAWEGERFVELGTLLGGEWRAPVDTDAVSSRHLAVLAMTGAGKSNAVGVLLSRLSAKGATVIVFDAHGEYGSAGFASPDGTPAVYNLPPKLAPSSLWNSELAALARVDSDKASRQYNLLCEAMEELKGGGFDLDEPLAGAAFKAVGDVVNYLKALPVDDPRADSAQGLVYRLQNVERDYGEIFDADAPGVVERIRMGKVNVVDLSALEMRAAETFVSHVLSRVLFDRKRVSSGERGRLATPVLVVVEEAHLFCPRTGGSRSGYAIERVAREGRKFGLGLVLVSQRPKSLNESVLSQMNNLMVMRLVEPNDQRYVQNASESLSNDLMGLLPALSPGEALLVGPWVPMPCAVRVDLCEEKAGGRDLSATEAWARFHRNAHAADDLR